MNRFMILRDSRERDGFIFYKDKFCLGTKITKLDTGDYTIEGLENILAIERKKTTGELAHNMCEKRFDDVIIRLSQFKYKFIVCEFLYDDILNFPLGSGIPPKIWPRLKVTSKWMTKFINELINKYSIEIVFAGDNAQEETYNIIKNVCRL